MSRLMFFVMKSYKIYLYIAIILVSFSELKSEYVMPQDSLGKHQWYIEIGGVAVGLSFNYEYTLAEDLFLINKINLRAGLGTTLFMVNYFDIPIMVNFLVGKNYCFELGIGLLLDYVYKPVPNNDMPYSSEAIKFIGNIGYRYIGNGGSIFRVGITPFYFVNYRLIFPTIGISFGHYF